MKRSISIIGPTLAAILLISGAIVATGSTTTLAAETTVAPALLRALPVQSEGEQILATKCTVCHDLGGVDEFQAAYDEGSLRDLVDTMISYGAQLNEQEIDTLVAYLSGNEQAGAPAFDEGAAADLVTASCTTCHDLAGIERGLYPADDWRETVGRMMGYGLSLSEAEFETIITYLGTAPAAQAGDDAAALDVAAAENLVNASCTTCHDLTGIERGLYSADEWSETVSRMLGYGLSLTEEEFEMITTYLGTSPAAAEDAGEAAFDEAAAAALLNASCTTCHDLTGIERGRYSADEWSETVSRMLGYGLSLTEEEFEMIITYLGTSPAAAEDVGAGAAFDEAAAADLLTSSCTTCHDLTGIERGLYSADEWGETVSRMLGYGLSLTEEEFDTIINYLGSSPDAAADSYDDDAAENLLNSTCTTCHDLTAITAEPGAYTEDAFRETIERMIGYGVSLGDDEINTLVRFLTETYGAQ